MQTTFKLDNPKMDKLIECLRENGKIVVKDYATANELCVIACFKLGKTCMCNYKGFLFWKRWVVEIKI